MTRTLRDEIEDQRKHLESFPKSKLELAIANIGAAQYELYCVTLPESFVGMAIIGWINFLFPDFIRNLSEFAPAETPPKTTASDRENTGA